MSAIGFCPAFKPMPSMKPTRAQRVGDRGVAGDHVNGHVPARRGPADLGSRLVVAQQHEHEIGRRTLAQIPRQVRERVRDGFAVRPREMRPVRPFRDARGRGRGVERLRTEQPRPVGLIRRRGPKRHVGVDRGEEYEQRLALARARSSSRVELARANTDPEFATSRSPGRGSRDRCRRRSCRSDRTRLRAMRPSNPASLRSHDTRGLEERRKRLALLSQQQRVVARLAHLEAGHQR